MKDHARSHQERRQAKHKRREDQAHHGGSREPQHELPPLGPLRPELMTTTEHVSPQFAAELLASEAPPLAVDVRGAVEREQKSIAGSLNLPLNRLPSALETLPKDRPLLLYCAGGYRSSIAASLLRRRGLERVSEIAGGITAWEASGLPLAGGTRSP